jgi:DNA-binding transcriptional LysR family regulator
MHSLPALPPLDGLVAMIAAARGGSFSAAAEELGSTHGAVSRRIRAVEVWLGTDLFERHGRGVRLTPAGVRFVRTVEQAFGSISCAAEQWRPHGGVPTLRLSVLPSFARLWLLPRLLTLQGDPPDLFLDISTEHRLADLRDGGIDLAIRYGAGSWPDLQSTLLFREELVPGAAPALVSRLRGATDPKAILRILSSTTRMPASGAPGSPAWARAIACGPWTVGSRTTTWCSRLPPRVSRLRSSGFRSPASGFAPGAASATHRPVEEPGGRVMMSFAGTPSARRALPRTAPWNSARTSADPWARACCPAKVTTKRLSERVFRVVAEPLGRLGDAAGAAVEPARAELEALSS